MQTVTLVVEIEEFLKEARRHVVDASQNDAIVMIRVPRPHTIQIAAEPAAVHLVTDDDDLITWKDAAWQ